MVFEYRYILISLVFSILVALILFFVSYFASLKKRDLEKISAYECGFQPFEDTKNKFDVRFYLVAILFIIFDLEIVFLFPWSISLCEIGLFGFWVMFIFLFILIVGFLYEWQKGALDWE